jgi:hypothetical protein
MPYNFELAASAEVTADVVKEMVCNLVQEQTGKHIVDVKVSIIEGQFQGFKLIFESEQAELVSDTKPIDKKPKVIDKKWKPFIWE